ncbi:MAG: restriction endonuclease [Janthinobacterium lividum]
MRLLTAAATSLTLLLSTACFAADRYQVRAPSFGCVVTWTTWAVNDQRNPRRHDLRWLRHVIDRGQCRMVGSNQQWEQIGRTNGLLLLRPVPSSAGVTSLFFRPNDLQRSRIAVETPVPVPLPVPVAPSVSSQDPAPPNPQPAGAADPAAAAVGAIPPAPEASPPAPDPVPDTAPPPVAAPASTPEPSAPPPSALEPPITMGATAPPAIETAPPALPAVPPPTVATPAAIDAAPVAPPAKPAVPTGTVLVVGLIAALMVLAGLAVLGLRRRSRRRLSMRWHERPSMERLDPQAPAAPDDGSDLFSPPIDTLDYRQRCVKSLGEAGWQARMSFPAGGLTADIIAKRDGRLLTMQCRPSTRPLESVVVQEALIVRRAQDANLAAVVSNAGYTKAARSFAAASGVRLLHETELPEFTG